VLLVSAISVCFDFDMSAKGQKRRFDNRPVTSGLPPTSDIADSASHVGFVPRVDIREMKEFANWQDGRPPDCAL
jgi:hypothetical protein